MIVGVLLAAGTGSRFDGANKLLADLDGAPVVARSARTLSEAPLDERVAVVGHERARVERALPEAFEIVANPDYEQGQSTSVRRGVEAARERGADAALFALGDMPRVSAETVEKLLREYEASDAGIAAPRREGRRGNPVLFDSQYFAELADVAGDVGGRALLDSEPVAWAEVEDSGIHRDVDTLADLREIRGELD